MAWIHRCVYNMLYNIIFIHAPITVNLNWNSFLQIFCSLLQSKRKTNLLETQVMVYICQPPNLLKMHVTVYRYIHIFGMIYCLGNWPTSYPIFVIMMLARRKTNVFLVGFLFMGEGVWILVNFILRKLFRLYQVLVTSTGKHHWSKNTTEFWTKMKNEIICF